jgi:hypothetical protein
MTGRELERKLAEDAHKYAVMNGQGAHLRRLLAIMYLKACEQQFATSGEFSKAWACRRLHGELRRGKSLTSLIDRLGQAIANDAIEASFGDHDSTR